jgi:hypothetical protein
MALRAGPRYPAEEEDVTENNTISRNGTLLEAEVDGEIVALNVESGTCYGFNSTATRIWSMIEQPLSLDEICSQLVQQFHVHPEDCRRDVVELLRELQSDGLIKSDPPLAAA